MNDEETWKAAPGFPLMEISSIGRLRSKTIRLKPREEATEWRIIKGSNRQGYIQHFIFNGVKHVSAQAHRLVAMAFIPNPEGKPDVNHINGAKNDNRVENLEWVTESENLLHSCRVLKNNIGEKVHLAKLSNDDVYDIRTLHAFGATQNTLRDAYGVNQSTISRVLTGAKWKSI